MVDVIRPRMTTLAVFSETAPILVIGIFVLAVHASGAGGDVTLVSWLLVCVLPFFGCRVVDASESCPNYRLRTE